MVNILQFTVIIMQFKNVFILFQARVDVSQTSTNLLQESEQCFDVGAELSTWPDSNRINFACFTFV